MSKFLLVSLTLLFSMTLAYGQGTSGVTGTVTDTTGAVVPGVKVTLLDTRNSREQSTVTSDKGAYSFTNLQPGAGYRITVTGQGFQTFVLDGVQIGVMSDQTHNIQLTPGQVTETVTVVSTSGDATLNTTDSSIGNIIGARQLRELPIQLRGSPAALIGLQPGAVGTNVCAGATSGNRTGSVAGSRADQGNVTLDGIDVNDQAGGFAFATVGNAPIDSIQEYRTITADQDAAEGRSAGGQVLLTTRSGTNEFHGSAYEYNRTAATAANDFFNNRIGVKRPALTRNQFGGSIGGPVKKDRIFFFFNYEGRRDARQIALSRTVPLAQVRAGGLGYVNNGKDANGNPCAAVGGNAARLNNPVTAQCVTILTAAQVAALDPQGVGADTALESVINSRYPRPNDLTGGDGVNTGLFRFNAPIQVDHKTYVAR